MGAGNDGPETPIAYRRPSSRANLGATRHQRWVTTRPVDGNLQEISSSATSANAGRMAMCHLIGRRRAAMKRRYSF